MKDTLSWRKRRRPLGKTNDQRQANQTTGSKEPLQKGGPALSQLVHNMRVARKKGRDEPSWAVILGVRDRLPTAQPFCDQLDASLIVVSVHDAHVLRIGAQVDTRCPCDHVRVNFRSSCPIPGRAIDGLDPDLARPLQLRRVRVSRPLSLPIIEDARRPLLLLRGFAPIPRRQPAILLPCAASQFERTVAVTRDTQETYGRRLSNAAFRQ